jgi:hypothetical protein
MAVPDVTGRAKHVVGLELVMMVSGGVLAWFLVRRFVLDTLTFPIDLDILFKVALRLVVLYIEVHSLQLHPTRRVRSLTNPIT